MKIIQIAILLSIGNLVFAQIDTNVVDRKFGISLNTSVCSYSVDFPSSLVLSYRHHNHQFEGGPKFQFIRNDYYKRQMGLEFNYRYYPYGIKDRFNPFLFINADFYSKLLVRKYQQSSSDPQFVGNVNQKSIRNYYTLNLGVGVQMNLVGKFYLGSNIGIGILLEDYEDNRTSTNENLNSSKGYFNEELNVLAALSLGYRF